jgi:DNA ligase 1
MRWVNAVRSWLKVINYQYEDLGITGLGEFGFLLSSLDGKQAELMEFMPLAEQKKLKRQIQATKDNDKFTFIEPFPCQVKYRKLTKAGLLRLPSFVKWRERF